MKTTHRIPDRRSTPWRGFTLIELLVVISIIGLLVAMLLPALSKARARADAVKCGTQLKQMHLALVNYVEEYNQTMFWRAPNIATDGMDWYVYGGRETGNIVVVEQDDLFNRFIPRPLNPYVDTIRIFQCPVDVDAWPHFLAAGRTHFGYVGNSYNFNADGPPYEPNQAQGGLAGERYDLITHPTHTVVFFDASIAWYPEIWHGDGMGNVAYADGHVDFTKQPPSATDSGYYWAP